MLPSLSPKYYTSLIETPEREFAGAYTKEPSKRLSDESRKSFVVRALSFSFSSHVLLQFIENAQRQTVRARNQQSSICVAFRSLSDHSIQILTGEC
jgi:hypothetical protein